jgi:DNA-binding response OmpR family regulator
MMASSDSSRDPLLKNGGEALSAPLPRILLADDDEPFRESLAQLLRAQGFDCVTAGDASQVVELLRTQSFDTLLSDICMPGNAGLELIEKIPQVAAGLPVILMTGRPTVETAVKSINLAVAGYFIKPPDLRELKSLLDKTLDARRVCQRLAEHRKKFEEWSGTLEMVREKLNDPQCNPKAIPTTQYFQSLSTKFAVMVQEMERVLQLLARLEKGQATFREHEMLGTVRRILDVIEQTRHSFKSKRLARLRAELELLLKRHQS